MPAFVPFGSLTGGYEAGIEVDIAVPAEEVFVIDLLVCIVKRVTISVNQSRETYKYL